MAPSARRRAARLNELAQKADRRGRWPVAEALYRDAIDLDPEWAVPWFNLGLVYKRQHRWDESLVCHRQALRLDERDDAANWNLGIAATAVGHWRIARAAWRRVGLDVPEDEAQEGFVDLDLGAVPIRVNPVEAPEVVWCHRLDPARARILNVPLPQSGRRYGDVVLHDGAPVGERQLDGAAVPLFDEIALLEPSAYATFAVTLAAPSAAALAELAARLAERAAVGEDWSSVRRLCAACERGRGDERRHRHVPPLPGDGGYGIAAREEAAVRATLEAWRAAGEARAVRQIERVL
jgi:tetratricopeptide (TPR) repeat protein